MVYRTNLTAAVDAAVVSPDADEEVHGDQHHFPEEEEEKEVEGEKDADDADFEHQQHDEKFLYAVLDAGPGGEDRDGGEEGGQDDQEEADAVKPEVIVDGRDVDPLAEFLELVAGYADLDFGNEKQGEKEFDGGDGHGQASNPNVIVGAEQKQREAGRCGEKDDDGEQIAAVKH